MAPKTTTSTETRTSDDLAKLVTELRREMQTVRDELKTMASAAGTAAKSELDALRKTAPETARELLHKAEATAEDAARKAKRKISTAEETVEAQAAEHPWRTLGIVGLAGFALGLLIRR